MFEIPDVSKLFCYNVSDDLFKLTKIVRCLPSSIYTYSYYYLCQFCQWDTIQVDFKSTTINNLLSNIVFTEFHVYSEV